MTEKQTKLRIRITDLIQNPDGIYAVCETNPDAPANLQKKAVYKITGKVCPPPPVVGVYEAEIRQYVPAYGRSYCRTPEIVSWQSWYTNAAGTQIIEITSRERAEETTARISAAEKNISGM